jgi:hypothetical protein
MYAFEQYGVCIGLEPVDEIGGSPGTHDVWQGGKQLPVGSVPFIVVDGSAKLFQFQWSSTTVGETVQMNHDLGLVQRLQLIKHLHGSAIIRWVGYVEANDV